MIKPPPPLYLPLNRDAALAIEQAIGVLKAIIEKHPEVRRDFDCESFIHHELAPALEALRAVSPEDAAHLALRGIEVMLESVQEDLRNQDPGNHATIGALNGEGKGLTAAKLVIEGAIKRCQPQKERP